MSMAFAQVLVCICIIKSSLLDQDVHVIIINTKRKYNSQNHDPTCI